MSGWGAAQLGARCEEGRQPYSNAHTVTARIHERVRVSDLHVQWTTSVVRRAAARQPFPV